MGDNRKKKMNLIKQKEKENQELTNWKETYKIKRYKRKVHKIVKIKQLLITTIHLIEVCKILIIHIKVVNHKINIEINWMKLAKLGKQELNKFQNFTIVSLKLKKKLLNLIKE